MIYTLTRLKQSFAEKIICVLNAKYKTDAEGIMNKSVSKSSK